MKIKITSLENSGMNRHDIFSWPVWTCNISEFDWEYDTKETCFILEGEVVVKTPAEEVYIHPGDLVEFPSGLKCTWKILKPVKKHYSFR